MINQPTPTPIKLTDEVLTSLENLLDDLSGYHEEGHAMVAAVRTLRDRARAVVAGHRDFYALNDAIKALGEVLPEAKP